MEQGIIYWSVLCMFYRYMSFGRVVCTFPQSLLCSGAWICLKIRTKEGMMSPDLMFWCFFLGSDH